jgi:DNA-binding NtrC family response regulator
MHEQRIVVLIVDDEIMVRMALSTELQDAGFTTIEAMNGADALEQLNEDNDIDVVVSDIRMPGAIDGFALSREVVRTWPDKKVVLMSGDRPLRPDDLPGAVRYIAKPYEIRQLVALIRTLVYGHSD